MIKIDDRSKKQGLKKGENIMRVKRLVSLALAGMLAASVAVKRKQRHRMVKPL